MFNMSVNGSYINVELCETSVDLSVSWHNPYIYNELPARYRR